MVHGKPSHDLPRLLGAIHYFSIFVLPILARKHLFRVEDVFALCRVGRHEVAALVNVGQEGAKLNRENGLARIDVASNRSCSSEGRLLPMMQMGSQSNTVSSIDKYHKELDISMDVHHAGGRLVARLNTVQETPCLIVGGLFGVP